MIGNETVTRIVKHTVHTVFLERSWGGVAGPAFILPIRNRLPEFCGQC